MVVVERAEERKAERDANGTIGKRAMKRRSPKKLAATTPDLVILSLLAERPMHGYQANLELERRNVREWAAVSRPQIYYSLEKLATAGFIRAGESEDAAAGPDRRVFETTAKGRHALSDALERENWTTQRDRPAFLTWVALSWQARPGVFKKQIARRAEFLEREIAHEKETLDSILAEVGHPHHEAVWMVTLMIEHFQTELKWLRKIERELPKRSSAKNPDYAK
jgi:DNA-binding PadR family transcriptional regulator